MTSLPGFWTRGCWLLLAVALLPAPARAEADHYLPNDTEIYVDINLRQLLDAPALKDLVAQARDALKELDQVQDVLKDLGFDPFKDLDRLTYGRPAGAEVDRGLLIVRGRFNKAKLLARAEEALKSNPDILKVHKIPNALGGSWKIYEVAVPVQDQETALFVALANDKVLLASPGKDYVVDALKKSNTTGKATLKNKDFQALLDRMDDKQSVSVAALGSALLKGGAGKDVNKVVKDFLEKLDALGAGITVDRDVKLEVVLAAKTAAAARDFRKTVNDSLNQGIALLGLLASQKEELGPVLDIVKSIRVSARDKVVKIRGEITAEVIESLGKVLKP